MYQIWIEDEKSSRIWSQVYASDSAGLEADYECWGDNDTPGGENIVSIQYPDRELAVQKLEVIRKAYPRAFIQQIPITKELRHQGPDTMTVGDLIALLSCYNGALPVVIQDTASRLSAEIQQSYLHNPGRVPDPGPHLVLEVVTMDN